MSIATHYSLAQETEKLRSWSKRAAVTLRDILAARYAGTGRIPLFCYSGMSGVGHATALALAYGELCGDESFAMMYVRKQGEGSHGIPIESRIPDRDVDKMIRVFVDDLIAMGFTANRCIDASSDHATQETLCVLSEMICECTDESLVSSRVRVNVLADLRS